MTYIFASKYPKALLVVMYQYEFQTARDVVL